MSVFHVSASTLCFFFFFNDTATTEIYTLSLHDALPIYAPGDRRAPERDPRVDGTPGTDRKSTRLNSSHANISYAVFCLKKKQTHTTNTGISHTTTAVRIQRSSDDRA